MNTDIKHPNTPPVAEDSIPPGYKRTEVGPIPDDWMVSQLGDCGEVVMGQSPAGSSYNRTGIGSPLINGPTEFTDIHPIKIQWTTEPTRFCKPGDLLICVRGSSTGRTNYADDAYTIGRGVAAIRAKDRNDTGYLSYQIISAVVDILTTATGSTFPSIDGRSIRKIAIPRPTEPEQRAIAKTLSDVDGLIGSLDKLIAKKRAIKQAAMQQLLTGKTRLPGFKGEWTTRRLGDVALIKTGKKNNEDKVEDGSYPFFVRSQSVERINTYSYDGEAILVPGEGGIGSIYHYIVGKFDYHQRVYKISDFAGGTNGKFVFYYMTYNFNKQATRNSVKATVDSLRLPTFQGYEFTAPTFDEQCAIVTVLSDMDAEIAALMQRRDKTKAIKRGMMQELLTGRVRLITSRKDV